MEVGILFLFVVKEMLLVLVARIFVIMVFGMRVKEKNAIIVV